MTTYTLFSQAATGSAINTDQSDYTMGVQFSVSASGYTLGAVWFYSASGAANLPGTVALYQVSGTSLVHSETASWSGAAGSGWIRAAFTSPPSLTSGTSYKACVLRAHSNTGKWYSATSGYWTTGGAGSGGITNGALSAPDNPGSATGQDCFNASGTLTYPASTFGSANYWVDPEITGPYVAVSPASASIPQAATGTVAVSLSAAPASTTTVTTSFTSGNTGLSVASGGTLTFTTVNWATPQNVTFAADEGSTGTAVFTATATGYTSAAITVTETQGRRPVRSGLPGMLGLI